MRLKLCKLILLWLAIGLGTVLGADVAAATETTSLSANKQTVRLKPVLSVNNMNSYSVGAPIDVLRTFRALTTGCSGAIRAGRPCSTTPNNVKVTMNPAGGGDKVMSILYRQGTYGTNGGSQWYTEAAAISKAGQGMLEYDVYFPSGFQFNKGGKLPGLFGGNYMCSGSKVTPNGKNCFSARLMWRTSGQGETYFYVPITKQQAAFCARCNFWPPKPACKKLQGQDYCSWNRGAFTFARGQWTKVQQFVRVNTPGKTNGIYQLYINKQLVMASSNVLYRTTSNLQLKGMLFSTFMGGHDPSWAPRQNQWAYFRNIRLYAPA